MSEQQNYITSISAVISLANPKFERWTSNLKSTVLHDCDFKNPDMPGFLMNSNSSAWTYLHSWGVHCCECCYTQNICVP